MDYCLEVHSLSLPLESRRNWKSTVRSVIGEVRLIGADGEQKGVVSIQVAMRAAEEAGLILVKIAPQATPPVCKVLDYGKYRFEQQKKEKEAKKNQKVVEVKETRLSLNIDTNDFNTKLNQATRSWPLAQGQGFDPLPRP